jgi:thiol-disulfide isomerase/thioredoxin
MPESSCCGSGGSDKSGGGCVPAKAPLKAISTSPLIDMLGSAALHIRGRSDTVSTTLALANARLILVYVSASWCGPCRAFTPQLADFYNSEECRSRGGEIVFASLDRDESSYNEYFAKMPWTKALPYGTGEAFASKYSVRGVPTLLLFTSDGTLLTNKGVELQSRAAVNQGPKFPWITTWGADELGRTIKLTGLEKRAELNGLLACVIGATEATERYSVKVLTTGETISVRSTALLGKLWGSELIGKTFILSGLEKRADLNNLKVTIISGDEKSLRFNVQLIHSFEIISVRRENIV